MENNIEERLHVDEINKHEGKVTMFSTARCISILNTLATVAMECYGGKRVFIDGESGYLLLMGVMVPLFILNCKNTHNLTKAIDESNEEIEKLKK